MGYLRSVPYISNATKLRSCDWYPVSSTALDFFRVQYLTGPETFARHVMDAFISTQAIERQLGLVSFDEVDFKPKVYDRFDFH